MGLGDVNRLILRSGLSVVAALLLSTASFAQDAATDDGSTVTQVVDGGSDPAAGGEGIAVGEPDPAGDGTEPDPVDDGSEPDPADDGSEPDPVDDGSEPDPADDGTDPYPVDDGSVTDPVDDNAGGDTGEEVTWEYIGGGDDPVLVVDDGMCVGDSCALNDGQDGDVFIYYMTGDMDNCIDCNVAPTGGVGVQVRPRGYSEVQRNNTSPSTDSAPVVLAQSQPAAIVTPQAATGTVARSEGGSRDVVVSSSTAMAKCLAEHARSTWICEWQNGAGQ